MTNLQTTIKELRKTIAADEKALNIRKEGLALLEKASNKLPELVVEAPLSRKRKVHSIRGCKSSVAASVTEKTDTPGSEISFRNRPRKPWTEERRAKTLAASKKARAAKKKAAK